MSEDDLESFRKEWKKEIEEEIQGNSLPYSTTGTSQRPNPSPSHTANGHNEDSDNKSVAVPQIIEIKKKSNNCPECNIHPAFRENIKCYTCLFVDNKRPSTKFYPFRIVDDLLNTKENCHKENEIEDCQQILKEENSRIAKKRKYDTFQREDVTEIFSKKQIYRKTVEERYLDLFIADLDEINEIPFFDLTVPREVAIKIFEPLCMRDLCRCSQVSKSWKSLADDELLWCRICHELGYEKDTQTVEKTKWKMVVKQHVEQERKLVYNWKNRLGKFSQLQHVHGGILCAVNSSGDNIVSGYTNGDVKLWNTADNDCQCLFQPSNTSLIIDESAEDGTIPNNVSCIAVSPNFIVAGYRQGNVDIWKTEGKDSTLPVHVIDSQDRRGIIGVDVAHYSDLVIAVCGPRDTGSVHACQGFSEDGLSKKKPIYVPEHIVTVKIFEDPFDISRPQLLIATSFKVTLYRTEDNHYDNDIFNHMTNIHHLIGSPVTCVNVRPITSQLAIGLGSYGATIDPYRVKVYDIHSNKLVSTLYDHTWTITCLNFAECKDSLLVTGSGDRRVRVFDMKTESMTHSFSGHSSQVNTVQMDDIKVVSGGDDGFVRVWDLRMAKKLWEIHNRHPVKHCNFTKNKLIVGNVPTSTMPVVDEYETVTHRRYRGSVQVYDFSVDQTTQGVPDICLSTYDEPEASRYNIGLAVPYDKL